MFAISCVRCVLWDEEDQWHFTLTTGTARTKMTEAMGSKGDFVSETGWVNIQVVGADATNDVLSRLPEGESVFWRDELHIGQPTETDLQLPPEEIADAIEEYPNSSIGNLFLALKGPTL